jgi:hypothetical protein
VYGRQPHLPVDFLLRSNDGASTDINTNRWVEIQAEKLAFAFNLGKEEIQRYEDDRKKRYDV